MPRSQSSHIIGTPPHRAPNPTFLSRSGSEVERISTDCNPNDLTPAADKISDHSLSRVSSGEGRGVDNYRAASGKDSVQELASQPALVDVGTPRRPLYSTIAGPPSIYTLDLQSSPEMNSGSSSYFDNDFGNGVGNRSPQSANSCDGVEAPRRAVKLNQTLDIHAQFFSCGFSLARQWSSNLRWHLQQVCYRSLLSALAIWIFADLNPIINHFIF